jgi:hypothetical protein
MATGVTYYGRISTNVISHYFLNEVWEGTLNHRPFFQALKKRGHIESGLTGQNLVWNVNAGRHTMDAYDDAEVINITRKKHEFQASLPWAFLTVTDAITRDEVAMAGSETALRRVNKDMLERMRNNFQTRISAQALTQDGNATGTNVLHGAESFFGNTGTTGQGTNRLGGNDTYANVTTASGSQSGVDNLEPDAWTPQIINYSSTGWNTTGVAWRSNLREVLTFAHDRMTKGNQATDRPDLGIVDRTMLSTMKDVISSSQRLIVTGSPSTSNIGLGIPGGIEYDGVEYIFDNDQTANVGHLYNFNHIYMDVLAVPEAPGQGKIPGGGSSGKDDMFEVLVKEDITTNGVLVRVNFRAQLRFHPRYQAKLIAFG